MSELQLYTRPEVWERLKQQFPDFSYLPMRENWIGDALTMLEDQRLNILPRTRVAWALIFMPSDLAVDD